MIADVPIRETAETLQKRIEIVLNISYINVEPKQETGFHILKTEYESKLKF